MKILIIGGSGRLGRVLGRILLEENYTTISLGSRELDLRDDNATNEVIGYSPDYIIHTAALTNVDECERNPKLAYSINSFGTEKVAKAADKLSVPLLYISTDYVFDGENPPYSENDEPNPVSVYGKSKLLGEDFVNRLSSSIVLRVSWLFGPEGRDFVSFVMRADNSIPVVGSQISKPTCTVDISHAIKNLINSRVSGIYHFANPPAVSRTEWVKTILRISKTEKEVTEVNWNYLNVAARRPLNSSLSTLKYEGEFGKIRSWEEGLREIIHG